MNVKKIELAWVVVADFNRAKAFYTGVLGLSLHESNDEYGWLEVMGTEGGAALGIARGDGHGPIGVGQNAVVTMTVENLDEGIKELWVK